MKLVKKHADKLPDLKAAIDYELNKALFGRDEKTDRFQKSWLYYLCKAPDKQPSELSSYVEPVLRRAVETLKPSLMNIFTENEKKAVTFRPSSLVQPGMAAAIDDTINRIFLEENDGYNLIERAITEAMVTGDCFMKVYMEEEIIEEDPIEVNGLEEEQLAAILEEYPDTKVDNLEEKVIKQSKAGLKKEAERIAEEQGLPLEEVIAQMGQVPPETVTYSGRIVPKRVEDKIRIERIDFSDIFLRGVNENIQDLPYVCHRRIDTIGNLVEHGYDKDTVMKSGQVNGVYDYLSTERLVNFNTFTSQSDKFHSVMDDMTRRVYIYEHYIYSSILDPRGKLKLYQVTATDTTILDIEEIDFIPFVHGVIERVPGSLWGVSLYDKFRAEQDFLSHAERAIQANAMHNVYQRYVAVKGQYDRQSLLNNRPGSVIEVNQAGSVDFFPQSSVPPTMQDSLNRISQTVERTILSSVGVDVTGSNMSATAAAITANSADLKDKVMARTLAYSLFRPLFKAIYNLMRASDPQGLPKVAEFTVDVNTANDDGVLSQQLVQLMTMFSQTPDGLVNKHEVAKTITGLSDEDVQKYFPPAPQPTPEQQQAAMEQEALQKELAQVQLESAKASLQLTAMEVVRKETELAEFIKTEEAERLRKEEESLRKFQELELKKGSLDLKAMELAAEVESGRSIGVGQY